MRNEFEREAFDYLKRRIDELADSDNAAKYKTLLIPLINLLWEQESGLRKGGKFTKEWLLNDLKIRVTHNE